MWFNVPLWYAVLLLLLNVKINVALSENASRTRYTIKIELKLRKWVLEKKSFQLSFERREWTGWSDNGRMQTIADLPAGRVRQDMADIRRWHDLRCSWRTGYMVDMWVGHT